MGAARHLILVRDFSQVNFCLVAAVVGVLILLLEFNAIKNTKLGPMTSVSGVVHSGVVLTAVLYLLVEITTR